MLRVGVITASDRSARGERPDRSGPTVMQALATLEAEFPFYRVLPDDREALAAALREAADCWRLDLVFVTGGTGLDPRDQTPEAIRDVIERDVPGIPEAMRTRTATAQPLAILSRSVAGVRGRTLIISLPGSPSGVRECLAAVLPVLPHAVQVLRGGFDHPAGGQDPPERFDPPADRQAEASPAANGRQGDAPPIISFVGASGSGKTTLLVKVIRELKSRGYRVAVVKHDVHGPDLDRPGKDTWLYRQAGADAVAIASPGGTAVLRRREGDPPAEEVVSLVAAGVDVVLTEGYKHGPFPKIEVCAPGARPLKAGDPLLLALVGPAVANSALPPAIPRFDRDDARGVTDLIVARFLARGGGRYDVSVKRE